MADILLKDISSLSSRFMRRSEDKLVLHTPTSARRAAGGVDGLTFRCLSDPAPTAEAEPQELLCRR